MNIEDQVRPVIAALCRKYSQPPVPPEIKFGDQAPTEASVIGAKSELTRLSGIFHVPSGIVYPSLSKHLTDLEHCNIRFIDRALFVKMLIDGQPALIRSMYKLRFGVIQKNEFPDLDSGEMLDRDFRNS